MVELSSMPPKKRPSGGGLDSPFKSADRLYKEDNAKSENRKRFERWTDAIVRERKLSPDWKDDPDAELKVKWIDGKSKVSPIQKKLKG
jgi:hypothetical protein